MNSREVVTKKNLTHIHLDFFIFSSKDMLFVVHTTSVKGATYTPPTPSRPMRSGGRILILVRQPDPRFTPRV